MATVQIQRRKHKKGVTYPIYFKNQYSGKKEYFKTFPKFKDAQKAANDLRAVLDTGKLPDNTQNKLNPLTFKEIGQRQKEEWNSKLSRNDLSPKTYEDYCIFLNKLNHFFGRKLLCQITKDEVEIYRNTMASELSKVTSNRYLFIIKQVFKKGLSLKAILEDPVKQIHKFSEKDHERKEFLLPHQLDRLVASTQKSRAKFYMPAVIYLGAEHGASKQEILNLNWKDIIFDYSDVGLIKLFRTKNKKKRVMFLMPRTKEALLNWRDHLEMMRKSKKITEPKSDRVFCRIDGTSLKSFKKAWWNALKEAGIQNFHFHDLRHTFCSNLLLAGSDLKDVKEMIGHEDISMTDRYSHLTFSHMIQKQSQLADHYSMKHNDRVGVI